MIIFDIKKRLLLTSRLIKQIIAAFVDFSSISFSIIFSFYISDIQIKTISSMEFWVLALIPICFVSVFSAIGVYKSIVRYIDFSGIFLLLKGTLLSLILIFSTIFFNKFILSSYFFKGMSPIFDFENSFLAILSSIILVVGSRLVANDFFSDQFSKKRVAIYGAGSAGIQLAQALRVSKEMTPITFIDDNKALQGTFLGGIKVIRPEKLESLVKKRKIHEVLIAMPSQSKFSLRSILKDIEKFPIKVRILPGVAELAEGKVSVAELKEVDIEDLLGRVEVNANQDLINKNIKEKIVLVTGAGGSIGREISRQVLLNNPKLLLIFDLNEFSLYSIKQELLEIKSEVRVESVLGDVRNKDKLKKICQTFGVQTIYHAAAYKHVPLVEENSFEAVSNNIFGTLNCALAAIESKVETFVLISTDKAVRPTNIMGATKRFSELVLQSLSKEYEKGETKITMVRFGNVLGSSGSAIPLFLKQIREGGPLTVTDPEVIRYFMSISEAAELVIQAGAMGTGGNIFVLDMGEPVRILDLAEKLIRLSGMEIKTKENPEGDIEIIFTGLRPGEKLFEELLIGDHVDETEHAQIYKVDEDFIYWNRLEEYLDMLRKAEISLDYKELRNIFKQTVSGFKPEKEIVDVIYLQQNNPS